MTDFQCQLIDEHLPRFTRNFDRTEVLLKLKAAGVLNDDKVRTILAMQSRHDSIVYLLTELKGRKQHAYVQLYDALNASGQEHLAKYLQLGLPPTDDLK